MRLTLRTLLAYLDDTLEPAEARQIGQKVAESDTAQELIARIKQVTRRRRLTTPPDSGPTKIDANTIADYLDNALDADQLAEVEQICLASDVHLAEMASCHQILTLVLGEPALVPPTAKQRMYALTKGRESIQTRKPPAAVAADADEMQPEGKEVDETLRLGLPALRSKDGWRNIAIILAGTLGLVACLAIVVLALLLPGSRESDEGPVPPPRGRDAPRLAQADVKKGKNAGEHPDGQKEKGKQGGPDGQQENGHKGKASPEKGNQDGKPEGKDDGDKGGKDGKPPEGPEEIAQEPPSTKVVPVGVFEHPTPPSKTVLLEADPEKRDWQRLVRDPLKPSRVSTGRILVSLPGYRSVIQTDSGVRLTLAGTMPELLGGLPLYESRVVLHAHAKLDLDLTLQRGRIALANTQEKPLRVRVRVANPTLPDKGEVWDVTLDGKGSEVLIDLFGMFKLDEPFYDKPDHPNRAGPVAQLGLTMLNGGATVHVDNTTYTLEGPPGLARLVWNSEAGPPKGPFKVKELEGWARLDPIPPPNLPKPLKAERADLLRALPVLSSALLGRAVDQDLEKALGSAEPGERKLAVRALAAVDMVSQLADALDDKRADVRRAAIKTLEHWLAAARANDYKLFAQLKERYDDVESPKIVTLLHGPPGALRHRPETYDTLIDQLLSPKLVIRELAAQHLAELWPEAAAKVGVDPTAPMKALQGYRAAWRKFIPRGKVPPQWDDSKGAGK